MKNAAPAVALALTVALSLAAAPRVSAQDVKKAPMPTAAEVAAITRLNVERLERTLAHDTMEGRQVGTIGAAKASAFIAAEMKRIGLKPAGDKGTYFQAVAGTTLNSFSDKTSVTVDGKPLRWNVDITAAPLITAPRAIDNVQVIYGGVQGDSVNTITAEQANGKVVVLMPPPPPPPATPGPQRANAPGAAGAAPPPGRGGGRAGMPAKFAGAVAVITVNLDTLPPAAVRLISNPLQATSPRATPAAANAPANGRANAPGAAAPQVVLTPQQIRMTSDGAAKLFGGTPVATLQAGKLGGMMTAKLDYRKTPNTTYTRNVIGIIPGTDPKLKAEWVLIDAHYDHLGKRPPLTPGGDSIYNGADDDASGTVAVLEIARAIKAGPAPKRSMIFAAMTGEESGLVGTSYYLAHPYVPMTKLVANMEIEMIGRPDSLSEGRGGAWLTGYERSTMGDMLKAAGIRIFPDKRPSQNFFSRSDNRAFACAGIPAHTLSTFNLHKDYHQRSDDADTIDFDHMTEVVKAGAYAARILADGDAPKWVAGGSPVGTAMCGGR